MIATLFRDVLFLLLLGFLALTVWMLPFLNPPASEGIAAPGNLIVTISWPDGDTDVDLWLDGPGEARPVGYSRNSGTLWNLLRDDRGTAGDFTRLNYENAFTRGLIAGDYTVNLHCFRCPSLPVPVEVEIRVKPGAGEGGSRVVAVRRLELYETGQERTAIRFAMDAAGRVDPESLHAVFRKLTPGGGEVP